MVLLNVLIICLSGYIGFLLGNLFIDWIYSENNNDK